MIEQNTAWDLVQMFCQDHVLGELSTRRGTCRQLNQMFPISRRVETEKDRKIEIIPLILFRMIIPSHT